MFNQNIYKNLSKQNAHLKQKRKFIALYDSSSSIIVFFVCNFAYVRQGVKINFRFMQYKSLRTHKNSKKEQQQKKKSKCMEVAIYL